MTTALGPGSTVATMVAVGDSFTEGLFDGPEEALVGWADRVALALARTSPGLRYANLAVRGRLLAQVVDDQLPVACAMAPDLLFFHAGGNDLLRPGVEAADVVAGYDRAVATATDHAEQVVLFTVLERSGATNRAADRLAARLRRFNDGVRDVAVRRGAVLVDVGGEVALHDRRLWHDDRLHLATDGHRRVAAAVLEALGHSADDPGWWRRPMEPDTATSALARVRADARWGRDHLAPWVWRRLRGVSRGDGMTARRPELTSVDDAVRG